MSSRLVVTRLLLVGLLGSATIGCATQRTAVRQLAARELACPEDAIDIARDEGRLYRATGCGLSVRVACHDPHASTGAHSGWADPLTAGKRSECEAILDRPVATTNATAKAPASMDQTAFDRALAAKLLAAAADRARTCGGPSGPHGVGHARITFAADGSILSVEVEAPFAATEPGRCVERELSRVSVPAFTGGPVTVRKAFDVSS